MVNLISSCDNSPETADVSKVTFYPEITVLGDDPIFVPRGSTFTDPGAIAVENGNEIDYTVTASGKFRGESTVNTNVVDEYMITYSAVNVDGFEGKATRQVIVYDNGDLVNDISGIYRATVTRNGVLTPQYTDLEYVYIWKNSNGTYEMSDGIGGYYDLGRGYGVGYAAPGAIITATDIPTNNFSFSPFAVGGFGGACTMNDMVVNPTARTINFTTVWALGYTFNVLLEQVQL